MATAGTPWLNRYIGPRGRNDASDGAENLSAEPRGIPALFPGEVR
jgi:hypothetical protein